VLTMASAMSLSAAALAKISSSSSSPSIACRAQSLCVEMMHNLRVQQCAVRGQPDSRASASADCCCAHILCTRLRIALSDEIAVE
jgi:hypothetical protein